MAQPARMPPELDEPAELDEPPVFDHDTVERTYRFHRARRNARIARRQQRKLARVRFWLVLGWLLLAFVVLAVTIWGEVGRLFGV